MKEKFLRRMYTLAKIFQIKFLKITILGKISFLYLEQHLIYAFRFEMKHIFRVRHSRSTVITTSQWFPWLPLEDTKQQTISVTHKFIFSTRALFFFYSKYFFRVLSFSRVYLFSFPMFFPTCRFGNPLILAYFSRNCRQSIYEFRSWLG